MSTLVRKTKPRRDHAPAVSPRALRCGQASALILAIALITACGGNGGDPPKPVCAVSAVTIAPSAVSVAPGGTSQLSASLSSSNCSPLPTPTWTSSAPTIATVSPSGLVTGVTAGSATITATALTATGTATVTVTPPPIASIEITPANATLIPGQNATLVAVAKDASGGTLSGRTIAWTSSAPSVATVTQGGVVTAVAQGNASISASAEGKSATASITVSPPPVATVTVTLNSSSLTPGQFTQAIATVNDAQGGKLEGRTIAWSSSNPAVATVDGFGVVSALAPGNTTIGAISEGKSGSAALTVTQIPVATVTLSIGSATMRVGDVQNASATTRDANGNTLNGRPIAWTSSNPGVASVSSAGVITANAVGATAITASSEGQFATAAITVTPNVASIVVTLGQGTLTVGSQTQVTATAKDAGGTTLTGVAISFATSNPAVASVSSSGLVTAIAPGTVNISATSGAITGSASLTVNAALVPVASVTVTPAAGTVTIGGTMQLTATLKDAGGATLSGRTITWSSSNPTVANVSSSGLVSAVSVGVTTISAKVEGVTGTSEVTVAVAPVASVVPALPSSTIGVASQLQATATIKDDNGQIVTRAITWRSSNTGVATISPTGLITAVAAGTSTISATVEGVSGNVLLTVVGTPTLNIVQISPAVGSTQISIETVFQVTFSENIDPTTVNSASVALTSSGSPVAASRTTSGKVVTIIPTSLLGENSTVSVTVTNAVKSVVGNQTAAGATVISYSVTLFDGSYYYRFFNNASQAQSLDTYSNTFQGFMGTTGGYSGQYWYVTPIGTSGYSLMRNAFKGDSWYLEGGDGVTPVLLQNTAPTIFSGQAWKFVGSGFQAGCFVLQNANFGASKSLTNVGGSVIMQPTAATGTQCWSIARIGHR